MATRATPANPTGINPQTHCGLAGLPPVIRNRIFGYVLCVCNTVYGATRLSSARHPIQPYYNASIPPAIGRRHSVLSILETCKLFYLEAEQIFYAVNTIEVRAPLPMFHINGDPSFNHWTWVESLNMPRLHAIKDISIVIRGVYQTIRILEFSRVLPNLQTVRLVVTPTVANVLTRGGEDYGESGVEWLFWEIGRHRMEREVEFGVLFRGNWTPWDEERLRKLETLLSMTIP